MRFFNALVVSMGLSHKLVEEARLDTGLWGIHQPWAKEWSDEGFRPVFSRVPAEVRDELAQGSSPDGYMKVWGFFIWA